LFQRNSNNFHTNPDISGNSISTLYRCKHKITCKRAVVLVEIFDVTLCTQALVEIIYLPVLPLVERTRAQIDIGALVLVGIVYVRAWVSVKICYLRAWGIGGSNY